MSLSSVWNTVYPIIIAILFFELIIIIHEGGHYFAARLMKIKVNEFSVGMGPKIFLHRFLSIRVPSSVPFPVFTGWNRFLPI